MSLRPWPTYVGSKFAAVVVVKGRQPDSNRRWFETVGTGIATTTGDPGRPVDWPMRWDCPHCGAHLTLDQDQARHVGRRRNLEVHAAYSTP